jgi:hypothetical protein
LKSFEVEDEEDIAAEAGPDVMASGFGGARDE